MIVTMIRKVSGTRDGVDWPEPGENIDVPDEEAASLIGNGLAKEAEPAEPATRKGTRQAVTEP